MTAERETAREIVEEATVNIMVTVKVDESSGCLKSKAARAESIEMRVLLPSNYTVF